MLQFGRQLTENVSASDHSLPAEQVKQLQELWAKDIQHEHLGW